MFVDEVSDLINDGKGKMEACGAVAEMHGFEQMAMYRAYERHGGDASIKRDSHCKLTEEQELSIVSVILAFDLARKGLPQPDIDEMAKDSFRKDFSHSWWTHFYERHEKRLAGRRKRGVKPLKNAAEFRREVRRWVEIMTKFLSDHSFPGHSQVNADEHRVYEKDGAVYLERKGARGRDHSTRDNDGERTVGTYIAFSSATTGMVMSVYVLRANFNDGNETVGSFYLPAHSLRLSRHRRPWPIYFIFTQTSYVTKEVWAKILDLFRSTWKDRYPSLDCLLWVDYAKYHYQPRLLLELRRDGIYIAFFPRESTKFTQPLDWWLFALLQQRTIKILADNKLTIALLGGKWEGLLWSACFQAELDTFKPEKE